ncbi:MAG TPA: glycoside hydrolase family 15 protein [Acidobacteriaceae bacterium]|nr:glycoside hydrolase family 15 protein [Acidobacteriaceae bacterium]
MGELVAEEHGMYRWIDGNGEAPGAPGLEPRWTSSQKSVVGTTYSTSSKIWWTTSHGIVNEIYNPTIDKPQVRDLELLVTDGESFVHEEKRDLKHRFSYLSPAAPAVWIVNSDPEGRYSISKEIISDPHAPVLLIRVRFSGDSDVLRRLKAFALLAPHLDGGGAHNNGHVLDVAGRRVLLAWRNSSALAMAVNCGFTNASCGFVGTSDGYQDVTRHYGMEWHYGSATDGNIALMGEVNIAENPEFVLAVGFGSAAHSALTRTAGALNTDFDLQMERFIQQWERVKARVDLGAASEDGGKLLKASYGVLLTHEDKTFAGAFIASASIPWGQAKGDSDLGGYHLVWTRDMVQTTTALLAAGRTNSAMRALIYLACTQKTDGGFPQNFWVNGAPYWSGMQLDETAFPILLAYRLWKMDALGDFDVLPFVERAAGFLVRHAPVTQQDRWEECAGYSPSTLTVVIAALIGAAEMVRSRHMPELAAFLEQQADWLESHLEDWTVTNDGVLVPGVKQHYMRIRPAETGGAEPCVRMGPGKESVTLANRGPGQQYAFEAREIVDGGFLETVRYGLRKPDDPMVVATVKVTDAILKRDLPQGPGFRRYNHDGYGNHHDGSPFDGWGQGSCWPLLTGERAHYELAAGRDISALIKTIEGYCSPGGMLPEQVWDREDLPECRMRRGQPTGSAMPLVWAHAEYIKLLRSATDGRVFDRVDAVAERYAKPRVRGTVEVWRRDRQVKRMDAQRRLRVETDECFELRWSADGWKTAETTRATAVGSCGFYADACPDRSPGAGERLEFTLYWPQRRQWEGRNYSVMVER